MTKNQFIYEDALMDYILLPYLNVRHHELFGISEERKATAKLLHLGG